MPLCYTQANGVGYDKAMRIIEKQIQEMNRKQKGKEPDVSLAQ